MLKLNIKLLINPPPPKKMTMADLSLSVQLGRRPWTQHARYDLGIEQSAIQLCCQVESDNSEKYPTCGSCCCWWQGMRSGRDWSLHQLIQRISHVTCIRLITFSLYLMLRRRDSLRCTEMFSNWVIIFESLICRMQAALMTVVVCGARILSFHRNVVRSVMSRAA